MKNAITALVQLGFGICPSLRNPNRTYKRLDLFPLSGDQMGTYISKSSFWNLKRLVTCICREGGLVQTWTPASLTEIFHCLPQSPQTNTRTLSRAWPLLTGSYKNLMFLNNEKTHFLQFRTKNSQKIDLNITLAEELYY
jgi:hypothetical protein